MNNFILGYTLKNRFCITITIAIISIFFLSYLGFNSYSETVLLKYALAQQTTDAASNNNNNNHDNGKSIVSSTISNQTTLGTINQTSTTNIISHNNISEPFVADIMSLAKQNAFFRKEIKTADHTQVVLMSLKPGEDIGLEVHKKIDQILVFVQGKGEANINGKKIPIKEGDLAFIPAGTPHNFVNTGSSDLKLFTTYSPPNHEAGILQKTKAAASGYIPKGAIEEEG